MKQKIRAGLLALAMVLGVGGVATIVATPAAANQVSKTCSTGRAPADMAAAANWYYTTDSGGFLRAHLDFVQMGHIYGAVGIDYNVSFQSDTGTAWGTGSQTAYFVNSYTVNPPSAANGQTRYHPKAIVTMGANGDGWPSCTMTFNLY